MNIKELAFQNVKGNWRSYKMFFLSSCFSIFSFYMYMSIIFHPQMNTADVYIGITAGLYFCSFFILVFSIVFILYSSAVFIHARKKEFGLYMLLGATKQRIIVMMVTEQLIMGLGATVVGIIIGTLFLKLFFMIFSVLLHMPGGMPFLFSIKAALITLGIYGLLFSLLSIYNALTIWKFEIIHLLRGLEKGRKEPKRKDWLALFSVFCVGFAYGLTEQVTANRLVFYFLMISLLTTIGTYFICKYGVIGIVYRLKKTKKGMYKHPYMFVWNQLLYRVKDNRRFFFLLTMATTFVVTATACVYFWHISNIRGLLYDDKPHAFSYIDTDTAGEEVRKKEQVERLFQKYDISTYRYSTFQGLSITLQLEKERPVTIIGASDYNREARQQGRDEVHIEENSASYIYCCTYGRLSIHDKEAIYITFPDEKVELTYNGVVEGALFNSYVHGRSRDFLLIHDKDFERFAKKVHDNERYTYHGYMLASWEGTEEIAREWDEYMGDDESVNNINLYKSTRDVGILILFVGSFISMLFFLASCSITYFKWFNNVAYDRKYYQALSKLGMTKKEVHRVLRWQLAIPFFFPIALGCLHSGVALHTYTRIFFDRILLIEIFGMLVLYFVVCIVYFFFAQREYMKHIR